MPPSSPLFDWVAPNNSTRNASTTFISLLILPPIESISVPKAKVLHARAISTGTTVIADAVLTGTESPKPSTPTPTGAFNPAHTPTPGPTDTTTTNSSEGTTATATVTATTTATIFISQGQFELGVLKPKISAGVIAGGVIGGLVAFLGLVALTMFVRRRRYLSYIKTKTLMDGSGSFVLTSPV